MDFRILGPLEAVADGRVVALDAAKPRALLAILLLHAGEPVSRDRLIEDLWDGRPPATAAKVLQTYVSQLRKALGSDVIVTRPGGLRARRRAGRFRPAPLRASRGRSTWRRADGREPSACARRSRSGAGRRSPSSPTSAWAQAEIGRLDGASPLGASGSHRRGSRSRPRRRPRRRARAAGLRAPALGAAARPADARALPLGQAGRGAGGLPGGAGDAGRDARDRAGRRAAAARARRSSTRTRPWTSHRTRRSPPRRDGRCRASDRRRPSSAASGSCGRSPRCCAAPTCVC